MTPKEKAEELVNEMFYVDSDIVTERSNLELPNMQYIYAKRCALIAVDEVIEYIKRWGDLADDDIREFEDVKEEINKL